MVAVAMAQERRLVHTFEQEGVTSPERARSLTDLGIAPQGIGWRLLNRGAIIRESSPGLYYLDLPSWHASVAMRRQRLVIGLVLVVALAVWFYVQHRP